MPSGKPSGDRPVRLPGQVLHAALQEWEFTELHNGHKTTGQPLYCQGIFDAITMGEVQIKYYERTLTTSFMALVTGAASENQNQKLLQKSCYVL